MKFIEDFFIHYVFLAEMKKITFIKTVALNFVVVFLFLHRITGHLNHMCGSREFIRWGPALTTFIFS